MIRLIGCLGFGVWLLAISTPAAEARNCAVPTIRTLDNQTVQGTMYAVSGRRCSIVVARSPGPIYTTRLVAQAKNGRVSVSGNRIVYPSKPGYSGDDSFVYARQGLDTINRPITRTVEVNVKVAASAQ